MSDIKFNKVQDGELLKWDTPGVKLVGVLNSYKEQKTAMGQGHVYEVRTKDGMVPFFAPSLLHKKLQGIAIGNIVEIEYTKKTKTGAGTDLKHFEVGFVNSSPENLRSIGIEMFEKKADDEISADDIDFGNDKK